MYKITFEHRSTIDRVRPRAIDATLLARVAIDHFFFVFRPPRPPRAARETSGDPQGGLRTTPGKKKKKKYAIRDSNPENLLGRQKCYPYTNGVFPTSF